MSSNPTSPDPAEVHRGQMKALQEEMRSKIRASRESRGLILVNTGNGKGKSTAAFGMLSRSLAHGHRCGVIQFIKASPDAVEKLFRGPLIEWHAVGAGFTWDTQNREADIARCRSGWEIALRWFRDPDIDFILLDELNVVLSLDYLPLSDVLQGLRERQPGQHVVLTGRDAPHELRELADLVTEMREEKHPFNAGVKAQAGLEF